MFVESWDEFSQTARQMYQASPMTTKSVIRYNHEKGRLVMKVSDDKKCIQFKTDQQTDAKKMNELNQFFLEFMSGARREGEEDVEMLPPQPQPVPAKKGKKRG